MLSINILSMLHLSQPLISYITHTQGKTNFKLEVDISLTVCKNQIMRIVSGCFKNRSIVPHGIRRIAPTTEFVRDMVFSIIGCERIKDSNFLDLFCGSGAVGLEALSRGASTCTFVDNDSRIISSLSLLVKEWSLTKNATIVYSDASKWISDNISSIEGFSNSETQIKQFDLIYAHPPYFQGNQDKLRTLIGFLFAEIFKAKSLFTSNSLIFLEIPRSELGDIPSKSGASLTRKKLKQIYEKPDTQYKHQFDTPWNSIIRKLSIPLEFPLYDWRVTSSTAILIFGAHADEPTREIV